MKRNLDETYAYKEFAKCLVKSVYKFHRECKVEFKAINFKENDCEDLLELNPNIVFHRVEEDFSDKSQEYYKGFLMYNRTLFIEKLLKRYNEPVVYLDTDCMLRGRIGFIESKLNEGFDMLVLVRPRQGPKTKFNAGVIAFNHNKRVMDLIDLWKKCMGDDLEKICTKLPSGRSTGGDQKCLWLAYRKSNVLLHPLPNEFNDGLLKKHSVIWHGHSGEKSKVLKTFLKEIKRK
jgi:hypothetical protein